MVQFNLSKVVVGFSLLIFLPQVALSASLQVIVKQASSIEKEIEKLEKGIISISQNEDLDSQTEDDLMFDTKIYSEVILADGYSFLLYESFNSTDPEKVLGGISKVLSKERSQKVKASFKIISKIKDTVVEEMIHSLAEEWAKKDVHNITAKIQEAERKSLIARPIKLESKAKGS
jgi:hypothetical protein